MYDPNNPDSNDALSAIMVGLILFATAVLVFGTIFAHSARGAEPGASANQPGYPIVTFKRRYESDQAIQFYRAIECSAGPWKPNWTINCSPTRQAAINYGHKLVLGFLRDQYEQRPTPELKAEIAAISKDAKRHPPIEYTYVHREYERRLKQIQRRTEGKLSGHR